MVVYIEETLKGGDLPADLVPHLVYGEVMEGARKPLVFLAAVREDMSLVGNTGVKISVPVASQLTARTASESTIDTSGYTADDITMTDTDITIGNEVYSAVKLSRILMENQPDIDWLRLNLRNMGAALSEKLDADIRDALIAGAGATSTCASAGTLAISDITGALAATKTLHWVPEEGSPPMLFAPPVPLADILGSTTFTEPSRYTAGDVTKITGNAAPLIGGCLVKETSGFATPSPVGAPYLALIVMPPNHKFGPSTILAWKRPVDVKVHDQTDYARTMYITSARYGIAVVNANAIRLLSNC